MNLAVTNIIRDYHGFEREFWLSYKALEAVMDPILWDEVKMHLLQSKRIDAKYLAMVKEDEYELAKAQIDADWRQKNEESKALGTQVHEMIHNELVTDLFAAQRDFQVQGELQPSDTFLMAQGGLFPEQRMEWELDPEYLLVGIADLISIHDGIVDIIDWKTDEDGIKFKSRFDLAKKHAKKMKYPLTKFDDVNGIHYQLQLSIYAWMIKQLRPDLQIGKLKLVWIRDLKVKKVYEVEYLEKDVENLIKWHLKRTKLKIQTDQCREIDYQE